MKYLFGVFVLSLLLIGLDLKRYPNGHILSVSSEQDSLLYQERSFSAEEGPAAEPLDSIIPLKSPISVNSKKKYQWDYLFPPYRQPESNQ
ncbi:hypothetical protein [Persicobacter sp. CCB-QB2]|uniref:hypothetical protein n=1 Tax=Persicobacter sp. CCB-QB2 TaxID=1561025 RepID=UPI0006A998E8|nr:hypothetical protein [Persicobacter sp. CCB-QB2]